MQLQHIAIRKVLCESLPHARYADALREACQLSLEARRVVVLRHDGVERAVDPQLLLSVCDADVLEGSVPAAPADAPPAADSSPQTDAQAHSEKPGVIQFPAWLPSLLSPPASPAIPESGEPKPEPSGEAAPAES